MNKLKRFFSYMSFWGNKESETDEDELSLIDEVSEDQSSDLDHNLSQPFQFKTGDDGELNQIQENQKTVIPCQKEINTNRQPNHLQNQSGKIRKRCSSSERLTAKYDRKRDDKKLLKITIKSRKNLQKQDQNISNQNEALLILPERDSQKQEEALSSFAPDQEDSQPFFDSNSRKVESASQEAAQIQANTSIDQTGLILQPDSKTAIELPPQSEAQAQIDQRSSQVDAINLEEKKSEFLAIHQAMMSSFHHVEDVNCPICFDLVVGCRVASCGHTFCCQCLSECLLRKKQCPVCRQDIRKQPLRKSQLIDRAVKSIIRSKKNSEEMSEYERQIARFEAFKEWRNKHVLNSEIKVGEKVDIRDTEYIWCVGTVEVKIKTLNHLPLLYVHYNGWHRKYDEFIYYNSERLAPSGTYTLRSDIPHYNLNPFSNAVQASIVESGGQPAAVAAGIAPQVPAPGNQQNNLQQQQQRENNQQMQQADLQGQGPQELPQMVALQGEIGLQAIDMEFAGQLLNDPIIPMPALIEGFQPLQAQRDHIERNAEMLEIGENQEWEEFNDDIIQQNQDEEDVDQSEGENDDHHDIMQEDNRTIEDEEQDNEQENQEELDRIDGLSQIRRQQQNRIIEGVEAQPNINIVEERLNNLENRLDRMLNLLDTTNRSLRSIRNAQSRQNQRQNHARFLIQPSSVMSQTRTRPGVQSTQPNRISLSETSNLAQGDLDGNAIAQHPISELQHLSVSNEAPDFADPGQLIIPQVSDPQVNHQQEEVERSSFEEDTNQVGETTAKIATVSQYLEKNE